MPDQIPAPPPGYTLQTTAANTPPPPPPGYELQTPDSPVPIKAEERGIGAALRNFGTGLLQLPGNIVSAFKDEPKDADEAMGAAVLARQHNIPEGLALGLHRLIIAPMVKEHNIANAYETIHKSLPADQQEKEKDFFSTDSNLHKANMHRIGSMVPLLGPIAGDISEHYLQGDKSGAVTSLLANIAAGKGLDSVTKGIGKRVGKIAPRTASVAGEEVPVMAGQTKDAAPIAKEVAAEPSPEIAEQQQTGAQKGVKNVATDALNRQLSKVGRDVPEAPKQLPPAMPEKGILSATYTDEGLRTEFGIPDQVPIRELVDKGLFTKNADATFSVASIDAARKLGVPLPNSFTFNIRGDLPTELVEGKGTVPAARTIIPRPDGEGIPNAAGGEGVAHGSGGASVEELARGEKFWRIKRNGQLSYNGTSPDANLQDGEALIGVKPDGTLRVQNHRTPYTDAQVIERMGPKVSVASRVGRQLNVTPMRPSQPVEPASASARPDYSRKWQYLTSGTEAGETVTRGGQGTLHTADPEAAQTTLDALKGVKDPSPAVQESIASLEKQLKDYHAYDGQLPQSTRPPVPKTGRASSFGDAAAQVRAAAQPTFRRLDQLSDNAFTTYQNTIQKSRMAMRRATTVEDMEAAEGKMREAHGKINDLMDQHASQFQPNELRNAQAAWRDMTTMDDIHSYVEKAFSAPESIASKSNLVKRTLDGNKLISNLNQMVDKIPAEDLQRVLGDDGLNNLYELGQLTSRPEAAANLNNVVQQVASKLAKSGTGAAVGGTFFGKAGAVAGGVADVARDAIYRAIATKPRVASLTLKALKFGTPAKIYAPLIAQAINQGDTDDSSTLTAQK